jgi:hypothetical protein
MANSSACPSLSLCICQKVRAPSPRDHSPHTAKAPQAPIRHAPGPLTHGYFFSGSAIWNVPPPPAMIF